MPSRLLFILVLIFATALTAAPDPVPVRLTSEAAIAKVWKSPKVVRLIKSFVRRSDEFVAYYDKNRNDPDFWPYRGPLWEKLLASETAIFNDLSPEGDCAVVQLFTYLNDASGAEDTSCAVEKRGLRMLPILDYAMTHEICIPGLHASPRLLQSCKAFIQANPNFKGCEF